MLPLPTNTPFLDLPELSMYEADGFITALSPEERSDYGLPAICSLVTYSTDETPTVNQPVLALTVTSVISDAATQQNPTPPDIPAAPTSTSTTTTTLAAPSSRISLLPSQTSHTQSSTETQATAPESSSSSSVVQVLSASVSSSSTNRPSTSISTSLMIPSTTSALTAEPSDSEVSYISGLPTLSAAGVTLIPSGSVYILGSETLVAGGPPVTIGGTPVSLATAATALVVGTSTMNLGIDPSTDPTIIIASSTITAKTASNHIYSSHTLVPDSSTITVSETSIFPASAAMISAVSTSTLELSAQTATPPAITVEGSTLTANTASNYIYGSQTLLPGGPAITVSGTPISLNPAGTALIIGTSTISLGPSASSPFTATPASDSSSDSQTLVPVSLTPTTTALPASTLLLSLNPSAATLPVLTIAGSAVTADSASDFVYGTQTLVPGGSAITVAGTQVVLGGSSTLALGGVIVSLLGGEPGVSTAAATTTTGRDGVPFRGRAGGRARGEVGVGVGWLLGVLGGVGGWLL
ncbi:hypothetical protein MMC17_007465 [Xylographa soralifera]|nr:hypothetical protein [Xylographa soralifera]